MVQIACRSFKGVLIRQIWPHGRRIARSFERCLTDDKHNDSNLLHVWGDDCICRRGPPGVAAAVVVVAAVVMVPLKRTCHPGCKFNCVSVERGNSSLFPSTPWYAVVLGSSEGDPMIVFLHWICARQWATDR